MTKLEHALHLAWMGFNVFPLEPNSKIPAIDRWPQRATCDEETIRRWWTCPVLELPNDRNIGIATERYRDGQSLLVIDVDVKDGKRGDEMLATLALPQPNSVAITPSGGRHLIYITDKPVKSGVNVLGSGLDIRSAGGFIVGVGSTINERSYEWQSAPLCSVATPTNGQPPMTFTEPKTPSSILT